MIANGIVSGDGGQLISFGVAIIAGSVVVGGGAIAAVVAIDRRKGGKQLGCLGSLGVLALFFVVLLCLLATFAGILYAGCGVLLEGNH